MQPFVQAFFWLKIPFLKSLKSLKSLDPSGSTIKRAFERAKYVRLSIYYVRLSIYYVRLSILLCPFVHEYVRLTSMVIYSIIWL